MNVERLRKLYQARRPIYERALAHVETCLKDVVQDFSKVKLFRVALRTSRIKDFESLKQKAALRGIEDEETVFEEILDIAGVRLVTNNLSDIESLHQQIKSLGALTYDGTSVQDYVAAPQASGYRGLHFTVYCTVDYKGQQHKVPCEVQLRTVLQDAWAVLSQQDIYKAPGDLPGLVAKLPQRMADQLAVLDKMAQDIRYEISQLIPPSSAQEQRITKEGLADLYLERFGVVLYDYQAQIWLNALRDEGAETIEDAEKLLPTEEMINKMADIYEKIMAVRDMPADTMLGHGVKIAAGASTGYADFLRAITDEYNGLMSIGRSDALAELPETLGELLDGLRTGEYSISGIWDALRAIGAVIDCDLCGTEIFSSDGAAEALAHHYGEEDEALLELLWEAENTEGVEVESDRTPGHCSHCDHLLKDENT